MITISPMYEADAPGIYSEFFQKAFREDRLGTMGHWLGLGTKLLGLKPPVKMSEFENLIYGRSPDGTRSFVPSCANQNRLVGWRMTLTAPEVLNSGWAVTPRRVRLRVERGFVRAVNRALTRMGRAVTNLSYAASPPGEAAEVFAVFRSKIACDGCAQLRATAVLFNFGLRSDGMVDTYTNKQIMHLERDLGSAFQKALVFYVADQLVHAGPPGWHDMGYALGVELLGLKFGSEEGRRSVWRGRDDREKAHQRSLEWHAAWREGARGLAKGANRTEYLYTPLERAGSSQIVKDIRNKILNGAQTAQKVVASVKSHFDGKEQCNWIPPSRKKDKDYGQSH